MSPGEYGETIAGAKVQARLLQELEGRGVALGDVIGPLDETQLQTRLRDHGFLEWTCPACGAVAIEPAGGTAFIHRSSACPVLLVTREAERAGREAAPW